VAARYCAAMSQENVEIARLMGEYFNRGDREAFQRLFAPDAELIPLRAALEETVYRGPNGSADFWADSDESWETLAFDPDEIRDLGDRVLLTGRLRGKARQTGVEVDSQIGLIATFANGKVTNLRTYASVAEALEAAGLRG
jgi:ketosteroid isomerase-like protein